MMKKQVKLGFLVLLLLTLVFVVGCSEREQVMVPPRADLQGAQRLAVVSFDNYTVDPGLSLEVETRLIESLQGYYHVVDRHTVQSALSHLGVRRGSTITNDIIYDLGNILRVDAIITGEIDTYFEDVSLLTPRRTSTYTHGSETRARWSSGQNTSVLVRMSVRVIGVDTGWVLYTKRVSGAYDSSSYETLSWSSLDPPPKSIVPETNRREIPNARLRAVRDAVSSFTVDLLPTYVWRRVQ